MNEKNKNLLIRGGTVVSDSAVIPMDLYVEEGRIKAQGQPGSFDKERFDEIIDASNMYVLPGLVDPHVHFSSPFMGCVTIHDFATGSVAAAFGGVTTVINFSTQANGESILKNIEDSNEIASKQSVIDWSFHGIILDANDNTLNEIPLLVKEGYPTFKCFTTYRQAGRMVDDLAILSLLKATAKNSGMLMVHCECDAIVEDNLQKALKLENRWINHALSRPPSAENVAIQRVIDLMKEENAPVYIVHTTTKESRDIIQAAIKEGLPIHSETCTHYLVLTEKAMDAENGFQFICSPPLRSQEDVDVLWNATINGPIEVVSSDDAMLPTEDKLRIAGGRFEKIGSGMPGIEPRLAVLYNQGVAKGKINLPRLVALTSTNPAKLFGLFPKKGHLGVGADADIVIFDPNKESVISGSTHHMNTEFSPFEGMRIKGDVQSVLCRGQYVIKDGKFIGKPGYGQLLRRHLDEAWLKRK